jgi:hypothetical protein
MTNDVQRSECLRNGVSARSRVCSHAPQCVAAPSNSTHFFLLPPFAQGIAALTSLLLRVLESVLEGTAASLSLLVCLLYFITSLITCVFLHSSTAVEYLCLTLCFLGRQHLGCSKSHPPTHPPTHPPIQNLASLKDTFCFFSSPSF